MNIAVPGKRSSSLRFFSLLTAVGLVLAACQQTSGPSTTAQTGSAGGPATASNVKTIVPVTAGSKLDKPVKLGFVSSLTGPLNDSSTANRRGFELAIDDWNAAGGFGGDKVEGVVYDDELKPPRGVELTQRLIDVDKVAGLIGYNFSGVSLAAIDIAQQSKVPMIVSGSGVNEVTARYAKESQNYIYGVRMNDRIQARVAFTFMRDKRGQKLEKIAIIHASDGYGQQGKEDASFTLNEMNSKPCAVESINPGDRDMTAQLQKIEGAGCDAVIVYTLGPETTAILQSAKKVNSKIRFFGNWGWSQPVLYQLAGEDLLKGIPFVQSYTVDHSPEGKALNDRLLEKYKESIFPLNSAQGYDATMVLLQAIAKAKSTDSAKVVAALESITGFKGTTKVDSVPYSKTDHEALDKPEMYFMGEWKNGAIVTAQ